MTGTVLFVDDEENILNAMERLLVDHDDIRVLRASNAKDGLRVIGSEEVHVVVSDNQMPGMKGVEFLSRVKTVSPDTIKVLMTGYADMTTAINAINEGGISKFLVKPWKNDELISVIQEGISRSQITGAMKRSDESTLLSLAQAIELKDRYTGGHCKRVAMYSGMISRQLGLSEEHLKGIKFGSWLHDCGKIGVPESILQLDGPLDEEQWKLMRKHPVMGAEVARKANFPSIIINIILYHHERIDGNGYPDGLSGDDIPIEAQIVAIADTFDALTSDRPYRKGNSVGKGIAILESLKDSHLNSRLIDIFISQLKKLNQETL